MSGHSQTFLAQMDYRGLGVECTGARHIARPFIRAQEPGYQPDIAKDKARVGFEAFGSVED